MQNHYYSNTLPCYNTIYNNQYTNFTTVQPPPLQPINYLNHSSSTTIIISTTKPASQPAVTYIAALSHYHQLHSSGILSHQLCVVVVEMMMICSVTVSVLMIIV